MCQSKFFLVLVDPVDPGIRILGFFSQSFCGKVPRNEENLVVQGAASAFKARPVDENIW